MWWGVCARAITDCTPCSQAAACLLQITVFSWRYEWATQLLNEILLLAVYVYTGLVFRPSYGRRLHKVRCGSLNRVLLPARCSTCRR